MSRPSLEKVGPSALPVGPCGPLHAYAANPSAARPDAIGNMRADRLDVLVGAMASSPPTVGDGSLMIPSPLPRSIPLLVRPHHRSTGRVPCLDVRSSPSGDLRPFHERRVDEGRSDRDDGGHHASQSPRMEPAM